MKTLFSLLACTVLCNCNGTPSHPSITLKQAPENLNVPGMWSGYRHPDAGHPTATAIRKIAQDYLANSHPSIPAIPSDAEISIFYPEVLEDQFKDFRFVKVWVKQKRVAGSNSNNVALIELLISDSGNVLACTAGSVEEYRAGSHRLPF